MLKYLLQNVTLIPHRENQLHFEFIELALMTASDSRVYDKKNR